MKNISVDLMQYALVGASLFILIAAGFVALWLKGLAKRDAKKELKNKKKAEEKQQKLEAKQQAKVQKNSQQPNLEAEAAAQAEAIARAEAAAQAEAIARAEAAAQAEAIARAEAAAQAEAIARAEAAAQAEAIARAEAAAQAEAIARAEAAAQAEAIARAEAVAQAEAKAKTAARLEKIERAKVEARVEVTPRRDYDDLVAGATVAEVSAGVQIPRFETAHIESERVFTIKFYKMQTSQLFENYSFRLDDSLTIGRNPGYHHWTIVDDPTVSGNHCKIYQKDNHIYILDLNSTNGTYVNDQRVRGQMELENHDKISIGQGSYRVRIE